MKTTKISISGIPALVWGEKSDQVYLYVHGKMSSKETAENFAAIAEKKGYQTISFDLPEHGERKGSSDKCDIWTGIRDLTAIADHTFAEWNDVSLYACSLGAYFSLHSYAKRKFSKCLFQSPIIDMEYLIRQMFVWFGVTEERLRMEKEVPTEIDLLRWDYFQYVRNHPVTIWNVPTYILFAGKDHLQTLDIMQKFAVVHNCSLTVANESEHPFMAPEDEKIVTAWLIERI